MTSVRRTKRSRALGLLGAAGLAAAIARERRSPSACPYSQRWMIDLPRPGLPRRRLHEALAPGAGARLLEVGPGTGYYTLEVAERLGPEGRLDVFDVQQEMLDHTLRAAARRGIENVEPALGDARSLPYPDGSFAGAFLVTVLGEVHDQDAALRELRRVLAAGGRLVVGETALDPHFVTLGSLRRRAEVAGLRFERRTGSPLAYFARFAAD